MIYNIEANVNKKAMWYLCIEYKQRLFPLLTDLSCFRRMH